MTRPLRPSRSLLLGLRTATVNPEREASPREGDHAHSCLKFTKNRRSSAGHKARKEHTCQTEGSARMSRARKVCLQKRACSARQGAAPANYPATPTSALMSSPKEHHPLSCRGEEGLELPRRSDRKLLRMSEAEPVRGSALGRIEPTASAYAQLRRVAEGLAGPPPDGPGD